MTLTIAEVKSFQREKNQYEGYRIRRDNDWTCTPQGARAVLQTLGSYTTSSVAYPVPDGYQPSAEQGLVIVVPGQLYDTWVALEVFPVVHLEQELLIDRQPAERGEQSGALGVLGEPRTSAGAERLDRDLVEVDGGSRGGALAPVLEQDVARDREQVGPERALALEARATPDALEKGLLY